MATINLTKGGDKGYPHLAGNRHFVLEGEFDAVEHPLAQNDIAQVISIPANSFVQLVKWEVERVEGAARNFAVGDGSDDDGFITATSANSLAKGASALALTEAQPNTVTGYTAGKFYGSADTIDIKAPSSGGLTGCKIRLKAVVIDLN